MELSTFMYIAISVLAILGFVLPIDDASNFLLNESLNDTFCLQGGNCTLNQLVIIGNSTNLTINQITLNVTQSITLNDTTIYDWSEIGTTFDTQYLKLDASNDPLTGDLLSLADIESESFVATYDVNSTNFNGNSVYIDGSMNATMNITAEYLIARKELVILNESSLYIGGFPGSDAAKINVTDYLSIADNNTRKVVSFNKDVVISNNYNKSAILALSNINTNSMANVRIFAVNNFDIATVIGKENSNFTGFGGSSMGSFYNQFGNMFILNGPTMNPFPFLPNATEMHLGFYGNLERGDELSSGEFYNVTTLIKLTPNNITLNNDTYVNGNLTADNLCFNGGACMLNKYKVKVTKNTNQTIANGGLWNNVTFDNETIDTGNMHNITLNNDSIIINRDGYYFLSYHVKMESNDKVMYDSRIIRNGVMLPSSCDVNVGSKESSYVTLSSSYNLINLNSGDVLKLQLSHDDVGGVVDLIGAVSYLQVIEDI